MMEIYLIIGSVVALWMLCVFIESKRSCYKEADPYTEDLNITNYGIMETTDTLGGTKGKVNPNTSAKKRKRNKNKKNK